VSDIRLRKLRESDLGPLIHVREHEYDGMAFPDGFDDEQRALLHERVAHSGDFHLGEYLLAIEAEGRFVGEIQARSAPHAMPPGVFELGVALFDETDRGHGIGTTAVRLMTERLFADGEAHRVQATTDVDNAAMRGSLQHLGFRMEGVLRGFMPSKDGPRDYAMYAITDEDYRGLRKTWI
jgi:RimJ/RimL family protein N-acetyltransferase